MKVIVFTKVKKKQIEVAPKIPEILKMYHTKRHSNKDSHYILSFRVLPFLIKLFIVIKYTNLLTRTRAPFVKQYGVLVTDVIGCHSESVKMLFEMTPGYDFFIERFA